MGTSRPYVITDICNKIIEQQPTTVLDIGFGFGKYGFLAREYTDIWKGRYTNRKTIIHGIEIFKDHIMPHIDQIYDHVFIGDAVDILPDLQKYDMIICCDMLEHLPKDRGIILLNLIKSKCKIGFVSTPLNPGNRGSMNGNKYEAHISQFSKQELEHYGTVCEYCNHTLLLQVGK